MQPSLTRWMLFGILVLCTATAFASGPLPAVPPAAGETEAVAVPDLSSWLTPQPVQMTSCTIRCLHNPAYACTSEVGNCYLGPTTLYCDGAPYHCPCDANEGPCDGTNPWD